MQWEFTVESRTPCGLTRLGTFPWDPDIMVVPASRTAKAQVQLDVGTLGSQVEQRRNLKFYGRFLWKLAEKVVQRCIDSSTGSDS